MDNDPMEMARLRGLMASGEARALRERARLSTREIARAAEVDASTVWRWETMRRRPRGPAAFRYLRLLDLAAAMGDRGNS